MQKKIFQYLLSEEISVDYLWKCEKVGNGKLIILINMLS